MEEIKYKGRRIDNGEWVYGFVFIADGKTYIIGKEVIICKYKIDGSDLINYFVEVIPETVGQYTGLKDKNCKDIYEGDVLKGTSYLYGYQLANGKQFDYLGFVEWQSQCDVGLCYQLTDVEGGSWNLNQVVHRNDIDYCTGEIIGNVFENSELLESK